MYLRYKGDCFPERGHGRKEDIFWEKAHGYSQEILQACLVIVACTLIIQEGVLPMSFADVFCEQPRFSCASFPVNRHGFRAGTVKELIQMPELFITKIEHTRHLLLQA